MSSLPSQIKEEKLFLLTLEENLEIENSHLTALLMEVEEKVQATKEASNDDKRKLLRYKLILENAEILALKRTIADIESAIVRQKISIEFLENQFKLLLTRPNS